MYCAGHSYRDFHIGRSLILKNISCRQKVWPWLFELVQFQAVTLTVQDYEAKMKEDEENKPPPPPPSQNPIQSQSPPQDGENDENQDQQQQDTSGQEGQVNFFLF